MQSTLLQSDLFEPFTGNGSLNQKYFRLRCSDQTVVKRPYSKVSNDQEDKSVLELEDSSSSSDESLPEDELAQIKETLRTLVKHDNDTVL